MKKTLRYLYKIYSFITVGFGILWDELVESGFKNNTGHFYYITYRYDCGVPKLTYIICKGYKRFWINCSKIVSVVLESEQLNERIKRLGVIVEWKQDRSVHAYIVR